MQQRTPANVSLDVVTVLPPSDAHLFGTPQYSVRSYDVESRVEKVWEGRVERDTFSKVAMAMRIDVWNSLC